MITRRSLFAAGGGALALAGCAGEPVTADGRFPIMSVLGIMSDRLGFPLRAAQREPRRVCWPAPGPFTVFAPTNAALEAAPPAMRDGGAPALRNLIAAGRLRLADIRARDGRIRMLSGIDIRIVGGTNAAPRIQAVRAGAQPSGASATIIRPDLLCSNGMIQVIDSVLFPA